MFFGGDLLTLSMGPNTARAQWIEFRTPMLVKGRYKIWICYGQNGNGVLGQVGVDVGRTGEQIMPTLIDFRQSLSTSGVTTATSSLPSADPLMLTNGFKRYIATTAEVSGTVKGEQQITGTGWDTMTGRLVGTADIQTTDRHWVRITMLPGGREGSGNTYLDMIHFIPIDDDQNYPRFSTSGTLFKRP
ncbi:MAG: hypothetical protein EOO88_58585 [Pedobacter sp.]|nr:MAG: hypothetical protein EOO88_58585 [Pedobacter sp.]